MTKATSTRHRRSALSHAIGIICCRSLMSTVERIHITDAGRRAIERWVAAHRDSRVDGHFSAHGMPDPAPRASAGQNEEQLPKMMPKLAAGTVRGHTLAQFFAAALAHSGRIFLFHSEPGIERLLLASASIRLVPGPSYTPMEPGLALLKSSVTGDEKDYILNIRGRIHRFHTSRQPTNSSARNVGVYLRWSFTWWTISSAAATCFAGATVRTVFDRC